MEAEQGDSQSDGTRSRERGSRPEHVMATARPFKLALRLHEPLLILHLQHLSFLQPRYHIRRMITRHGVRTPGIFLDFLAPAIAVRRASNSIRRHTPPIATPTPSTSRSTAGKLLSPSNMWAHLGEQDPVLESQAPRPSSTDGIDTTIPKVLKDQSDLRILPQYFQLLLQSLERKNLPLAEMLWLRIQEQKLHKLLGPSDLDRFSRLITRLTPMDDAQASERVTIEDMAIYLATQRYTEPLTRCLAASVKKQQPLETIQLYNRFRDKWKGADDFEEVAGNESEDNDAAVALVTRAHVPVRARGSEIVLSAITAYTMQDDFQAAIQTALRAPFRISPITVAQFLSPFELSPTLLEKINIVIRHCYVAQLASRPLSFMHQLTNLKAVNTNALHHLYDTLRTALGDEYPWLAVESSQVSSKRPVVMREVYWSQLLRSFLEVRRLDVAEVMWDDMIRFGFKPTLSIWTNLITGVAELKGADHALALWRAMLGAGIVPDALAYHAIITGLLHNKRPNDAAAVFADFQQAIPYDGKNTDKMVTVYNSTLAGYLSNNREADARDILEHMKANGPHPTVTTYNIFLGHYNGMRDLKSLSSTLKAITAQGLKGNVFTFSTLLSALLRIIPREQAIARVFAIMEKHRVKPNFVTYSAIIDNLVKAQTEDALKAAFDLLRMMEESGDPELAPNFVTYTSILAGVYRWPGLREDLVEECAAHVVQKMKDYGIHWNHVAYNILIKACLANPGSVGVQKAMYYYRDMKKQRVKKTGDTWYIILHGLAHRGEWNLASHIVDDMMRSGLRISESLGSMAMEVKRKAGGDSI
ncbi:hypothetical protein BV25DRAFT_1896761 [Artomyces pyxidatus]|uniref:Uncharacterized protein n=1 Tax=Artomyces pyxidatus TaxID=48021 RepID=A0ACB8TH87_9AGAM|nr:hypothetical protein BV25DRAFT_1896761 [Artomyces pyxidatus]